MSMLPANPPQTIISRPVHTARWLARGAGAPTVEVGVHESSAGSYRTPVLSGPEYDVPPQPMSRLPVQIVLMPGPCGGADDGGGSQVLVAGSKRYVFPDLWLDPPPNTRTWLPVHTRVWRDSFGGENDADSGIRVQLSFAGSYIPAVSSGLV